MQKTACAVAVPEAVAHSAASGFAKGSVAPRADSALPTAIVISAAETNPAASATIAAS